MSSLDIKYCFMVASTIIERSLLNNYSASTKFYLLFLFIHYGVGNCDIRK